MTRPTRRHSDTLATRCGEWIVVAVAALAAGCHNHGDFGVALAPPPPGAGVQLRVRVPQAPDATPWCWYFRLPPTTPLEVTRIEVGAARGVHHVRMFRALPSVQLDPAVWAGGTAALATPGEPCRSDVDLASLDLVLSAHGELNWSLPDAVAYRLHADAAMVLEVHTIPGLAPSPPSDDPDILEINLWTAEPSSVHAHAAVIFGTNPSVLVPARTTGVIADRACAAPPGGATVFGLTGHFNARGVQFTVFDSADGTTPGLERYRSVRGSEPSFEIIDGRSGRPAPFGFDAGSSLLYRCEYSNPGTTPVSFGTDVANDERCDLYAFYYPADPDAPAYRCP